MDKFTNKVVIVAGAGGNLGEAVARAFLATEAHVALMDRTEDNLRKNYPDAADSANHLLAPCADMTNAEAVQETVSRVVEKFGRIDVLISLVGGFRAGTPLHETPWDTFEAQMNLNARTFWNVCHAAIPAMLKAGNGRIIGVGARPGLQGAKNSAAYSASKAAVIRLVESMSAELREDGITVNCVIPGTLDTPQNRASMSDADTARWVQPESLAEVILFLASDGARDVSGAVIPVYGRT